MWQWQKSHWGEKKSQHKEEKHLISFTSCHYVVIFEEAALYLPLFVSSALLLSKVKGLNHASVSSPNLTIEILESRDIGKRRRWLQHMDTDAFKCRPQHPEILLFTFIANKKGSSVYCLPKVGSFCHCFLGVSPISSLLSAGTKSN